MGSYKDTARHEQPDTATHRKPYKSDDVDTTSVSPNTSVHEQPDAAASHNPDKVKDIGIDANASSGGPHRSQHAQNEGRGLIAQLIKGLVGILGILFKVLAPILPAIVLCYFAFNIFRAAVDSACKVPGASYIFPYCQSPASGGNENFNALSDLQSRFVVMQEIGAEGMTLPLQLEYSKNVVREVASVVRYSKVPSREKICDHLTDFWQLTDTTGDGIGNFLQDIDRMMDSVITRNEMTLRNLKRIASSRAEPVSIGSKVVAVLFHTPLTVEHAVRRQYLEHLDKLTGDIDRLILNSQVLEMNLKQMSDIQWSLRDLIIGDHNYVVEQEQEVQARFWTWFGAYKGLLKDYEQQAAVLQGLDMQRQYAVYLVSDVTQSLKMLRSKLGDLRVRIQEPGLDMSGDLDVQIGVIQKSVDNLKAGKAKSQTVQRQSLADIKKQIEGKRGKS